MFEIYKGIFVIYVLITLYFFLIRKNYYITLLLLAFSIPFKSIYIDIGGAYLEIWKFVSLLVFLSNFWALVLKKTPKLYFFVWLLIFYTLTTTLISSILLNELPSMSQKNIFKSNLRLVSQIFLFFSFMNLIFVFYLSNVYKKYQILNIIKAFVISVTIVVVLGFIQWIFLTYSNTNIFPIPRLNEELQEVVNISSLEPIIGYKLNRINALSMEPKNLASYIAFMLVFIFEHRRIFRKPIFGKYLDFIIVMLALFVLFHTFSSLGYLMILIYFIYLFSTYLLKLNVKKIIFLIVILGTFVFMLKQFGDIFTILQHRSIGRVIGEGGVLFLEDFDEATVNFFINYPQYLFSGVGLGNIHKVASEFLPPYAINFAYGTAWTSKAGFLYILAGQGLVGIFLLTITLFLVIKKLNRINDKTAAFLKSILLYSVLIFFFRFNELFFMLIGLCIALTSKNKIGDYNGNT